MITQKHIAMYIGSLQKGGAERVMANLAVYFFEQGYKVTLVTTYLAANEYEVKHASWTRVPAGAPGAVLVSDTEENPVWINPEGGEKDGIKRVFSALLKSEQKGRAYNLKARSNSSGYSSTTIRKESYNKKVDGYSVRCVMAEAQAE